MPRPAYPDPVAPSQSSPLFDAEEGQRCGDTFLSDIEVRHPYQDVDAWSKVVPSVWGDNVLEIGTTSTRVEQSINESRFETADDLETFAQGGMVDENNVAAIGRILERATTYLEYAIALREHWATMSMAYVDHGGGTDEATARGWLRLPLQANLPMGLLACATQGKAASEVVRFNLPGGGWAEARCPGIASPDAYIPNIYAEDWLRYQDALQDAARWVRCAQEGLYSVVAYNVNKSMTVPVGPPSPPASPGSILRLPIPFPPAPPGGQGPTGEVPVPPRYQRPVAPVEPKWSTGKKVAVAVGVAAAVGGLLYLTRSRTQIFA